MKKTLLIIILSLLIFNSCNKDESNPLTPTPLTIPTLSSPGNGASDVAFPVTLIWNVFSGAASYTLQVSVDSAFTTFVFNQNNITTTTQQITGLSDTTTYYWRVGADNGPGPSNTWSFKTASTGGTVPDPPLLLAPVNNSNNQPVSLTLSWNASSGAVSYNLQVSTSNSFITIFYNQSGITGTTNQVSGLINSTKYYWRVSGTNNNGSSNWSGVWNFTTAGLPPAVPTLISPEDGATDVPFPVTFGWNASTGAQDYTLQVSTSSSFSNILHNQSGITTTIRQVSELSVTTTYYWRVIATNTFGSSNPSNTWSFTTLSGGGFSCAGTPTVTYSGKTYNTVQIGTQCWLKENLDVGIYVASINTGSTHSDVSNNGITEKYCYGNNESNCAINGGLYDWNEAMAYSTTPGTPGICPPGWHIPTIADFQTLSSAVNNNSNSLKAIGQGTGNGQGTNTSGFSALLAGLRNLNGVFGNLGSSTLFWSSTENGSGIAFSLGLSNAGSYIGLYGYDEESGFSVRCLKD